MNSVTLLRRENSWYLKIGQYHHFLCGCGHMENYSDSIILNRHHPDHRCSQCSNTHYLDSVMFLNNPKVIRWSIFRWNIYKVKTEEAWSIKAYVPIPVFNTSLQKIEFKERVLASNTLLFTGELKYNEYDPMILNKYVYNDAEKAELIKEILTVELEDILYPYALASSSEKTAWIEYRKHSILCAGEGIELLSFFLKYDH